MKASERRVRRLSVRLTERDYQAFTDLLYPTHTVSDGVLVVIREAIIKGEKL